MDGSVLLISFGSSHSAGLGGRFCPDQRLFWGGHAARWLASAVRGIERSDLAITPIEHMFFSMTCRSDQEGFDPRLAKWKQDAPGSRWLAPCQKERITKRTKFLTTIVQATGCDVVRARRGSWRATAFLPGCVGKERETKMAQRQHPASRSESKPGVHRPTREKKQNEQNFQ